MTRESGNRAKPTHAFIGRIPDCGCIVSGHVDGGDLYTLDWVRDMVKEGYEVDWVPLGDEAVLRPCEVHDNKVPA